MKGYLDKIDRSKNIDTDNFQVYNSMLKKIGVYDNGMIDYHLTCIPFGFHLSYMNERIPNT